MPRGFGEAEFARSLPEWVVAIAGLVTQLGDMWFVGLGIVVFYVAAIRTGRYSRNPRRDALYLLALLMGSYALTYSLKHVFALPRPPGAGTATAPAWLPGLLGALYEGMVTGDGFGFPSGHALKTTVVYGGAALTLSVWERRDQLYAAGAIVALVAVSRVVLGVHYVVDVVIGVLVGVGFLALVERATNRNPQSALLVAGGLGVLAAVLTGSTRAVLATAVAAGGLVLWEYQWSGQARSAQKQTS